MEIFYINEKYEPAAIHVDADTLEGACFDGMNMHSLLGLGRKFNRASFVSCCLRDALMSGAEVVHADFTSAIMPCISLKKAKAYGAIFRNCDMRAGHFEDADLLGADLSGANLRGATMLCENLESATLAGAKFDKYTVWPEGFNPLKHGAVSVENEKFLESDKEELRSILLNILSLGLIRVRSLGWDEKAEECAAEANLLHNLPHMIQEINVDSIRSFYNWELPQLRKKAGTRAYEADWVQLGVVLGRMQSRSTKRLSVRGVFKVLLIGYVVWLLGGLLFLIGYGIFSK